MKAIATCFATLNDLAAYREAIKDGLSQKQAFAKGDNGVGCWGDNTAQLHHPMCALSPETMIATWGSISAARWKKVKVTLGDRSVLCEVADKLPHNSTRIDLNPAALVALKLPGENVKVPVVWEAV